MLTAFFWHVFSFAHNFLSLPLFKRRSHKSMQYHMFHLLVSLCCDYLYMISQIIHKLTHWERRRYSISIERIQIDANISVKLHIPDVMVMYTFNLFIIQQFFMLSNFISIFFLILNHPHADIFLIYHHNRLWFHQIPNNSNIAALLDNINRLNIDVHFLISIIMLSIALYPLWFDSL